MTSSDLPPPPPRSPIEDLDATTRRLLRAVTDMGTRVTTTQETQAGLERAQARLERQQGWNRWIAGILVGILFLGAGFAFVLYRVDHNADEIHEITDRTSNTVLCPLFGILVAQVENMPPDAADRDGDGTVTAAEEAQLAETVKVIRAGFAALECQPEESTK